MGKISTANPIPATYTLSANMDYDTIIDAGSYQCPTDELAATMLHCPSIYTHMMDVVRMNDTVQQIVRERKTDKIKDDANTIIGFDNRSHVYGIPRRIFYRNKYDGKWGEWAQVFDSQNRIEDMNGIGYMVDGTDSDPMYCDLVRMEHSNTVYNANATFLISGIADHGLMDYGVRGVCLVEIGTRHNKFQYKIIDLIDPFVYSEERATKFGYWMDDKYYHVGMYFPQWGDRIIVTPLKVDDNTLTEFLRPTPWMEEKPEGWIGMEQTHLMHTHPRFDIATQNFYGTNMVYMGTWYPEERWFHLATLRSDLNNAGIITFFLNGVHAWDGYSGASYHISIGVLGNQRHDVRITRFTEASLTYDASIKFGYVFKPADPDNDKPMCEFDFYARFPRYDVDVTAIITTCLHIQFTGRQIGIDEPEGLIEVPYRVLQDEEQVRKIVQEEIAKLNT